MSKFPYKPRPAGSLKQATAGLVEACGGLAAAAGVARVGRTALFRYTDDSDDHADRYMPCDVLRALERQCGEPIVTRYLAAEAGAVLLMLPNAEAGGGIGAAASLLAKESADLFGAVTEAIDTRGKHGSDVSPGEARDIIKESDEAMAKLAQLRALAMTIRDGESDAG